MFNDFDLCFDFESGYGCNIHDSYDDDSIIVVDAWFCEDEDYMRQELFTSKVDLFNFLHDELKATDEELSDSDFEEIQVID